MVSGIWTEKYRPSNFEQIVGQDDIVKRVNLVMQSAPNQKPEFGRIKGINDELGTFFFMTR